MDTIYVAQSYQNFNKVGEPFEKDGKPYITIEGKCDKCGGSGRIEYFSHIDSGICYLCGGRGIWRKDVRVYSQKEYKAMEKRNQKAAEKKEHELEEKRKNAKAKWFSSNGFTDDGITYMLVGNTFSIKDELKTRGWKYNNILKWHGSEPIEDFPQFALITIKFDDIAEWNYIGQCPEYKKDAAALINRAYQQAFPPATTNFLGEVGERLRNIKVTYISCYGYDTRFGYSQSFRFETEDGDIIRWVTGTPQKLEVGDKIYLTGTVKEHKTYNGENITVLTRCKIVKEN